MCGTCATYAKDRMNRKVLAHWDHDSCLKAGRAWHEETGYAPRYAQWEKVGLHSEFPSATCIANWFGSWSNFIDELGLPQPPHAPGYSHNSYDCLIAGVTFIDAYGHMPSALGWQYARVVPSVHVIYRCFGTWNAFKDELSVYQQYT